jgi:hypothetical protein
MIRNLCLEVVAARTVERSRWRWFLEENLDYDSL